MNNKTLKPITDFFKEKEVGQYIKKAIQQIYKIYVMNNRLNDFQQLTVGQINKVFSNNNQSTDVTLDEGFFHNGRTHKFPYEQSISINDFWIDENEAICYLKESKNNIKNNEHFHETERNTLLKLVYGIAKLKYDYDPKKTKNSCTGNNAGSIPADFETLDIKIDGDTIRKHLAAGADLCKK